MKLTAEEVLEKHNNTEWDSEGNPVWHFDNIVKAMEEYALQKTEALIDALERIADIHPESHEDAIEMKNIAKQALKQ